MKRIINVYKDVGSWIGPPPGFGDFLRGSACLINWSQHGPLAGSFLPGVNVSMAAAAARFRSSPLHVPLEESSIIGAEEILEQDCTDRVRSLAEDFLHSDQDTLAICTNASWRGTQDALPPSTMTELRRAFEFTDPFEAVVRNHRPAAPGYILIHIRDRDRSELQSYFNKTPDPAAYALKETAFRHRAENFTSQIVEAYPQKPVVCMSNNHELRDDLCRQHGLINPHTSIGNPGYRGALTDGELLDFALVRDASALYSLTYFPWNSGFTVWSSRLYSVWAQFFNSMTPL